ncbi:MAG: hypothetical protein ABI851_15895 [Saprospiraceae bacterium]
MIEDWQYHHELGHGLIAHIFDGYLMQFNYLTFDESDIEATKFNSRDLGYTVALPIINMNDIVNDDIQKASLVDGMYLLSGIIGATYFGKNQIEKSSDITINNFKNTLDYRGSDGDFEIISMARRPYGFLIMNTNLSPMETMELHCKIYNILKNLFLIRSIQDGIKRLYEKLIASRKLLPSDFQEVFLSELTDEFKTELYTKISKEQFGNLLQAR